MPYDPDTGEWVGDGPDPKAAAAAAPIPSPPSPTPLPPPRFWQMPMEDMMSPSKRADLRRQREKFEASGVGRPTSELPTDRLINSRMVGWLLVAGGILIFLSCFLPWQELNAGIFSINRSILQYGDRLSMSFDGWIALLLALLICLFGARRLLSNVRPPSLGAGIGLVVCGGLFYGFEWLGTTTNVPSDVVVTHGLGGAVALLGVVLAGGGLIAGSRKKTV